MFKYIKAEKLEGCGILFINTNDPLYNMFQSVSKNKLPLIALWYSTYWGKKFSNDVILIDPYLGLIKQTFMGKDLNISKLAKSPAIENICVKKLKPIYKDSENINEHETNELNANFRRSVAKVISIFKSSDKESFIKRLFKYQIDDNCRSSISYIDMVFEYMGINNSIIELNGNKHWLRYNSVLRELGLIKNNRNYVDDDDKKICKYILNETIFEDITFLNIEESDELTRQIIQKNSLRTYSNYLKDLSITMIEMLAKDINFFNFMISSLNNGSLIDVNHNRGILMLLENLRENQLELIQLIKLHNNNGEMSIESYQNIFSKFDKLYKSSHEYIEPGNNANTIDYSLKSKLVLFTDSNKFADYKDNIDDLRLFTSKIIDSLSTNQTPVLNINQLVQIVNKLQDTADIEGQKLDPVHKSGSYNAVITSKVGNHKNIKICLHEGEHLTIPCYNPNLYGLSDKVLREILEYLDRVADGNYAVDNLRTEICYHLSIF